MITFSASKNAVCEVTGPEMSFLVFPTTPLPRISGLCSTIRKKNLKPKVVSWPGEYDIGGMIMRGVGRKTGSRSRTHASRKECVFAFSMRRFWIGR